MKPVQFILLLILGLSLLVCSIGVADEGSADDVETTEASVGSDTVTDEDAVSESVDAANAPTQIEDENTGSQSAATVEKPAAVQTASWGEIKRIFKEQ